MNVDFSQTTPTNHKQCSDLLSKVRAQSAGWPARWSIAKGAKNQAQMQSLLRQVEALGMMERLLVRVELQMRTALLDQEFALTNAAIRHAKKKMGQPCFAFNERLAERGRLAVLEDSRKEIDRRTIKAGVDYLEFAFRELVAGGVR